MKTKSKALLLSLCAVLLVAATVLATIAWLTAQDTVTNTFTVGDVKIKLWEPKTDELGDEYLLVSGDDTTTVSLPTDATQVTENNYILRPGHTYIKEPYIEILEGSEPCYLFITIKNELADLETNEAGYTIEEQLSYYGWEKVKGYKNLWAYHFEPGDRTICPSRYKVEYKSGTTNQAAIFGTFTLAGDADVAANSGKEIIIKAYAVQADGFDKETTSIDPENPELGSVVTGNVISDKELWEIAFSSVTDAVKESSDPAETPDPTT